MEIVVDCSLFPESLAESESPMDIPSIDLASDDERDMPPASEPPASEPASEADLEEKAASTGLSVRGRPAATSGLSFWNCEKLIG